MLYAERVKARSTVVLTSPMIRKNLRLRSGKAPFNRLDAARLSRYHEDHERRSASVESSRGTQIFPAPEAEISIGKVWLRSAVEEWA
jgi:hypothetical protein